MQPTTWNAHHGNTYIVLRDPDDEARERWYITRRARWQGAMGVLLLLLFWRVLFVAAALGAGVATARHLHKRNNRRRRRLAPTPDPLLLGAPSEADLADATIAEADARAHREALDDFDRRLMRSLSTGVEETHDLSSKKHLVGA